MTPFSINIEKLWHVIVHSEVYYHKYWIKCVMTLHWHPTSPITQIPENLFNAASQAINLGIILSKCWKTDEQKQHDVVEYLNKGEFFHVPHSFRKYLKFGLKNEPALIRYFP